MLHVKFALAIQKSKQCAYMTFTPSFVMYLGDISLTILVKILFLLL